MVAHLDEMPDHREIRCPILGHHVSFRYCRSLDRLPCRRIIDCWSDQIDAYGFLKDHYSAEDIAEILKPPQPKIAQILALIAKAKRQD